MKNSNLLLLLGVGAGAIAVYYLIKKTTGAVSTAANAVGSTIASPFEALYTDITGLSPTPTFNVNQSPNVPQCYYRDATGALMYDSNGNIMSGPCAPGDIGTTPYPG